MSRASLPAGRLKERMSDDNENGRGARPPLTLKRGTGGVSAGVVEHSFSHGRSKRVVVETKR